jgi:hypothetical protein
MSLTSWAPIYNPDEDCLDGTSETDSENLRDSDFPEETTEEHKSRVSRLIVEPESIYRKTSMSSQEG